MFMDVSPLLSHKPLEDGRHLGALGAAGGGEVRAAALNQSCGVGPGHVVLGIVGDRGRVGKLGEVGSCRYVAAL